MTRERRIDNKIAVGGMSSDEIINHCGCYVACEATCKIGMERVAFIAASVKNHRPISNQSF